MLVLQSLREAQSHKRAVNNPTWVAPEILSGEEYSLASDVYSFGLVLWELWTWCAPMLHYYTCVLLNSHVKLTALCSKHPFEEFDADIEKEDAIRAGKRPPVPSECWPEYSRLFQQCWVRTHLSVALFKVSVCI